MPHRGAYLLPVVCSLAIVSAPADARRTDTQTLAVSQPSVSSGVAGPSSAEPKAWWSELPDTLLDKGLLALVVAYAGFVLNGALERLKSEESLSSGLTDIRLKKAGEMSEAAYVWESHSSSSYGKKSTSIQTPLRRLTSSGSSPRSERSSSKTVKNAYRCWRATDSGSVTSFIMTLTRFIAAFRKLSKTLST